MEGRVFKIPSFRNLHERSGLSFSSNESTTGFGFGHDGRVDTLENYVTQGADIPDAPVTTDRDLSDLLAWLISAPSNVLGDTRAVEPNLGKRYIADASGVTLVTRVPGDLGGPFTGDIILRANISGIARSWLYDRKLKLFQSNRKSEVMSTNEVIALAQTNSSTFFYPVYPGTGVRIGLDSDLDGYFDQDEIDANSDPYNPISTPTNPEGKLKLVALKSTAGDVEISWETSPGIVYDLQYAENLNPADWRSLSGSRTASSSSITQTDHPMTSRYYRVMVDY